LPFSTTATTTKTSRKARRQPESGQKKVLFWSYDNKIGLADLNEGILIELVLKYGDLDDISELVSLYGKTKTFEVWEAALKDDSRFLKLNLFLARVFFGLDVEADYFKGGMHAREKNFAFLLPETENVLEFLIGNAPFLTKYTMVGGSALSSIYLSIVSKLPFLT